MTPSPREIWKKIKSNFNPILIPKLLGQAIVDRNNQAGGNGVGAYNVLYAAAYFACFLVTCYVENVEAKGYNFVSKLNFYAQFYGMSFFMCFLSLSVTFWKKEIYYCFRDLIKQLQELKKLEDNPPVHFPFTRIVTMTIILFVSQPTFIVLDLTSATTKRCFLYWVCLYLPGLGVNIYVADLTAIMAGCTNRFIALNHFLRKSIDPNLKAHQKFLLNKMDVRPERLMRKINEDGAKIRVFDKVFRLHGEACDVARRVNKACGFEFFTFFVIASAAILSFAYNVSMDFILESRGEENIVREIYACDYWAVMYIVGIIAIVAESIQLVEESKATKAILHQLMNIHPQLEYGTIYSLQLMQQDLKVSAAGFFDIDQSLIYRILTAWATYLLILIQFSSNPASGF